MYCSTNIKNAALCEGTVPEYRAAFVAGKSCVRCAGVQECCIYYSERGKTYELHKPLLTPEKVLHQIGCTIVSTRLAQAFERSERDF